MALRGPHSFSFPIVGGVICLLIYTFFLAVLFINSPQLLLLWLLLATALFASIALAMIHDIYAIIRLNRMTGVRIYIDREKNVFYYQDASKEKKEIAIDSIIDISGPKTLRIKYRDNSLQKNIVKTIGWTTREDVLMLREFCRKDETK